MKRPEQAIQRAVFQHLKARAQEGVFAFHVPNGGKRSAIEGAIFKGLGVVAGVPDILVIHKGRAFALELKAGKGRLTEAQEKAHMEMTNAGAVVGTANGLDEALSWLEQRGILKGVAV